MKRAIAVAGAMAIALCAASLYAQGKDFSGKWTVDAEKTAAANPAPAAGGGGGRGGGRGGGGGVLSITMDAKTIKIERLGADGTAMGTPSVYNLDGSESKIEMAGRGGAAPTTVTAKAKWEGAVLVITTTTGMGEQVAKYSLDGANLKVESTNPGRQGGAPTTRTTIYTKG